MPIEVAGGIRRMNGAKTTAILAGAVLFAGMAVGQAEPIKANQAEPKQANAGKPGDPYGIILKPIPEKLVVLTFDDSCRSHATFVGPLLKKYGFGGTFYISDAFSFRTRKDWYMTWEQIKALEDMGFEIGNHTVGHGQLSATGLDGCRSGLTGLERLCLANKVARPITFCWPFYSVNNKFLAVLTTKGYTFARGGGDRPYSPTVDNPLDAPSYTIHDNSLKIKDSFARAAKQAVPGRVVIFCFHGVPDAEHPAVGVEPGAVRGIDEVFEGQPLHGHRHAGPGRVCGCGEGSDSYCRVRFVFPGEDAAWPGASATSKGKVLYLCVNQLPADRKLALPGMTTRISRRLFPGGPEETAVLDGFQCGHGHPGHPRARILTRGLRREPHGDCGRADGGRLRPSLDFVFPGLPEAVISGNEIRVKVPLATDLTRLAQTYQTGSPLVAGKPASGSTQDFTRPRTYTVTAADGSTRPYVVTVIPTLGAVGVSNPSFEKFDVLSEYDDSMGKNPTGAVWTFKQAKSGDEVGINLLSGGPIFAPPAPDGTRHSAFIRGARQRHFAVDHFRQGELHGQFRCRETSWLFGNLHPLDREHR